MYQRLSESATSACHDVTVEWRVQGNNDEVVAYNASLSVLQSRLDRAHAKVVDLESVLAQEEAGRASRVSQLAHIIQ